MLLALYQSHPFCSNFWVLTVEIWCNRFSPQGGVIHQGGVPYDSFMVNKVEHRSGKHYTKFSQDKSLQGNLQQLRCHVKNYCNKKEDREVISQ